MKKQLLFLLLFGLLSQGIRAQHVFEHFIYYPTYDPGDIENWDAVVSDSNDAGAIITAGFYNHDQDSVHASERPILSSHDEGGTLNFTYSYEVKDTSTTPKVLNGRVKGLVEYDGGYIIVGRVTDNSYYGSTVPGGADVLIIKTNASGSVLASRYIDLGGHDEAHAIVANSSSLNEFILCGNSVKASGTHSFVLEIDLNLDVNWVTQMDLRISSGTVAASVLHDLIADNDTIWAVGAIRNTGTITSDGVVVKLDINGNYQTSKRVYAGNNKEFFYDVDLDGTSLLITGDSRGGFLNTTSRMVVLKYTKASHTVSVARILRTPDGGSYDVAVGYQIRKQSSGGYFVVGESQPSSGNKYGILHELNSSLVPSHQVHYNGVGNSWLRAFDIEEGTLDYLGLAGMYESATAYEKGYVIETDLQGYSGCSDSIGPNSTSLSLSTATLFSTDDNTWDSLSPTLVRYELYDSLICADTITFTGPEYRTENSVISGTQTVLAYPSPLNDGEYLTVAMQAKGYIRQVEVFNSVGQLVDFYGVNITDQFTFQLLGYEQGLYFIHISFEDNDGLRRTDTVPVLVQ